MKKTSVKLTKSFVDRTNETGEYFDSEIAGFSLRIRESGAKSYVLRGRVKGRPEKLTYTLGKHGDLTPDQARKLAADVKLLMRAGVDPRESEREDREKQASEIAAKEHRSAAASLTIRVAFESFQANAINTRESTKQIYRYVLYKHLADWLDTPMNEITEDMVLTRFRKVRSQTVSSAKNLVLALRRLYNWTMKQAEFKDSSGNPIVVRNPVTHIQSDRDEWREAEARTGHIKDELLAAWYEAVSNTVPPLMQDYFLLLILTGLRAREASQLEWSEIDRTKGVLCIPRWKTKNGYEHVLPITAPVKAILERRRKADKSSRYVFPSIGSSEGLRHLGDTRHYQNKVIEALIDNRSIAYVERTNYTPHALRRTFAQAAAHLCTESEVKALVNHRSKNDVTAVHYTQLHGQSEKLRKPLERVQKYILEEMKKSKSDDKSSGM